MKTWRTTRSSTTNSTRTRTTTKKRMTKRTRPVPFAGSALLPAALSGLLMLICISTLAAQDGKKGADANLRALQGTVLDSAGSPVQQAVVQLKDTRTLQVLSFITKEDGVYRFSNLKTDTEY